MMGVKKSGGKRKEQIKGVLLLAFCDYVIIYVTVYLLRLFFIRQAYNLEEIFLVPALIFLVVFAIKTESNLLEDMDETKESLVQLIRKKLLLWTNQNQ